jgi:hypothetical protein
MRMKKVQVFLRLFQRIEVLLLLLFMRIPTDTRKLSKLSKIFVNFVRVFGHKHQPVERRLVEQECGRRRDNTYPETLTDDQIHTCELPVASVQWNIFCRTGVYHSSTV